MSRKTEMVKAGDRDDVKSLGEATQEVMAGLDRMLRTNLEQCPRCSETVDCSELEMHEIVGCAAARDMYK